MCEIIIVWALGKMIAEQAAAKGRAGWPFVLMLIFFWIGGEIFGAIVGAILSQGEESVLVYGLALGGAVMGAVLSFTILAMVPAVEKRSRRRVYDDDDDEDDRPRRRSRRDDDDDDDDRPIRRPRRDEEDDDDEPRGKNDKFYER
jgi:hypothetical protein